MNTNERAIVRYANTRQMINEAERLIHETEKRLESKRFVDRCLTRIDALRKKLEDVPILNNYEEIPNLAEIDRERQTTFNNLMKDFVTISTNNKTCEDSFRIKDAQGRDLCDIYAMFSTRDLLPYKERSHRAYRIIYELINGQISRKVERETEMEINDGTEEEITEEISPSGTTVRSEETTEHESQESEDKSETRKATRSRVTKGKIIWNQRKSLSRKQMARAQPKDENGRFVKVAKSGLEIKEMVTLTGAQTINEGTKEEIIQEASPSGTTVRSEETIEHESQESEDKSETRKATRSRVTKECCGDSLFVVLNCV
ncbi:PREDICTED: uncharacterized protein LOC105449419 [Wasmannia auropunctata]|uniref:uncharacterized protein LOC105449419 n=1 Tax=Wasmannia auropunctata TaxID=64793 RepID=UPI0005EDBC61|nr:PREDICTED: uncharacterized protein LOC105449419 [Wasmannia auropunctata]